ncbi:DUF1648 domain-containing protein [Bacillaceae bacterium Marseille-Q3522]|nr:DUF1648 domain-containing protein [Bacillaceae bacterium Marseille-Q3522]
MIFSMMFISIAFLIVIETAIPFFVKRTAAFGVSVPDQHTKNKKLKTYKKNYSLLVFTLSAVSFIIYLAWIFIGTPADESLVLAGVALQFAIIIFSLAVYFYFYAKVLQLKKAEKWVEKVKQVKITDLAARSQDEMLPWYVYLLPMVITVGMVGYTFMQYPLLPEQIPTHWGPDGNVDAFTEKNLLTVQMLPIILFTMQLMFFGINEMTKRSGIKLSATATEASRIRQLTLRKYSSWFMLIVSILMTLLFSFLQLSMIHTDIFKGAFLIVLPFIFLLLVLGGSLIFALKVGKSDKFEGEQSVEGLADIDEDQYWKGGLFYFNKNDPSIFVEKRFGVGWTLNFAHPIGYILILGPLILILIITFLS